MSYLGKAWFLPSLLVRVVSVQVRRRSEGRLATTLEAIKNVIIFSSPPFFSSVATFFMRRRWASDVRQPLMEQTFDGRQTLMKNSLWWETTFDGRQPLMEDNLWWKMTFNGGQPLIEYGYYGQKYAPVTLPKNLSKIPMDGPGQCLANRKSKLFCKFR